MESSVPTLIAPPGFDRLWGPKPIGAKRLRRIGNSLECVHAIGSAATHLTMLGFDDCIHVSICLSSNVFSQSAASSFHCWRSGFWSCLETLM
jgi:hypothetical protein